MSAAWGDDVMRAMEALASEWEASPRMWHRMAAREIRDRLTNVRRARYDANLEAIAEEQRLLSEWVAERKGKQ